MLSSGLLNDEMQTAHPFSQPSKICFTQGIEQDKYMKYVVHNIHFLLLAARNLRLLDRNSETHDKPKVYKIKSI